MTSIFVAKLDFGVTKEQLTELFEAYGKVNKVNIPTDKDTGKPRGFAFVEMYDADEASKAIGALDGYEINRRTLAVKIAENRGDQKKPFNSGPRKDSNFSAPTQNDSRNSDSTSSANDSNSSETRKKSSKTKKRGFDSDNDRSKKTKMQAHKKSGKNFRYVEDDEPLENDLFLFDRDEDESSDD